MCLLCFLWLIPLFYFQNVSRTDALKKRLWIPLSWIDPNGVAPFMFRLGVEGVG